jgi:PKD repeat protein
VLPSGRLRELAGSPFPSGGEGPAFGAVMVSPNQGPEASFSATVRPAGRATRFDASDSADRDGRIVRYDWDFGDGTVATNAGPTPTHTYRQPGTFEVTVTVTDNEGCSTEFVFAGQSPLCTGSALARATRTVVITG